MEPETIHTLLAVHERYPFLCLDVFPMITFGSSISHPYLPTMKLVPVLYRKNGEAHLNLYDTAGFWSEVW
jgi:hypothetical protein